MQKIAIVVNDSWYAWNMRANLAFAFQKEGYEVVFICPYDEYSKHIQKYFKYLNISINAKGTNPIEDLKSAYKYYKIYKDLKPDIILHYTVKPNIYGTIVASMLNIPTINNIAGLGTLFMNQTIVTEVVKLLYRFSQRKASKIFFQNQDDLKMFIYEKLVPKERCDVLPGSGVDIEKFKPIIKQDDGVFIFLLLSRMLWAKGINEFIQAAKIIKNKYDNIKFQLVGHLDVLSPTAITKEQMNIWIQDGTVDYLGSSDDVRVEIANADCIVLPSYYREGTPRILLEAASMGKPIITTDNVGCRDVVEDGVTGYICKIKNSKDLADKMEGMLNLTVEKRVSMGKAGRDKVIKEYDEKIVIDKYLKSIKEILK